MKVRINRCGLLVLVFSLLSCQEKEHKFPLHPGDPPAPAGGGTSIESEDFNDGFTLDGSYMSEGPEESPVLCVVPYENRDGVKYIDVKVNGVGFEMIFDTGCSSTLISIAEARYLYDKGKLTADDIYGLSPATIADGSIVVNMVINLREVIIDGQIRCNNVLATVSSNIDAPLLLGNEVLDRLATITIDNEKEVLYFNLK